MFTLLWTSTNYWSGPYKPFLFKFYVKSSMYCLNWCICVYWLMLAAVELEYIVFFVVSLNSFLEDQRFSQLLLYDRIHCVIIHCFKWLFSIKTKKSDVHIALFIEMKIWAIQILALFILRHGFTTKCTQNVSGTRSKCPNNSKRTPLLNINRNFRVILQLLFGPW